MFTWNSVYTCLKHAAGLQANEIGLLWCIFCFSPTAVDDKLEQNVRPQNGG